MAGILAPRTLPMIVTMGHFSSEKAKVTGKENAWKGTIVLAQKRLEKG
jgi:hypothetical protein